MTLREPRAPKPILNELSQLAFTVRIIEEAEDDQNPFVERLRFVGIASANLQEYFMTHFARLDRNVAVGPEDAESSTRFRAPQVRRYVAKETNDLRRRLMSVWTSLTGAQLEAQGVVLRTLAQLSDEQRDALQASFATTIAPKLRACELPGAEAPGDAQSLPGFVLLAADGSGPLTWIEATEPLPTLVEAAPGELVDAAELITTCLPTHRDQPDATAYALRVLRASDDAPDYGPNDDPRAAVREALERRATAVAVRLEIDSRAPSPVRRRLAQALELPVAEFVTLERFRLAKACARALAGQPELEFPRLHPRVPDFIREADPFAAIAACDRLLHHPYDSFDAILDLLRAAARDPATRRIAMTLYRCGEGSPLIEILGEATARGVEVSALVELRARFDERTNLGLADALGERGVRVIHGPPALKVHSKMFLIEREEPEGLRRYVHLGTGNFHHQTGALYSDLSLLSASPELGAELSEVFAALEEGRELPDCEHLIVAPTQLRAGLRARIDAAIAAAKRGVSCRLSFKMNQLVDDALINRLYAASKAGVPIRLQVRGTCRLRPGVAGLSETIEVTSLVGRFLEHARVYLFEIGDVVELLTGSADLMPRNLDRRVEVLFPIRDPVLRDQVREVLLDAAWRDDVKARRLGPDARYVRAARERGFDLQAVLAAASDWRELAT